MKMQVTIENETFEVEISDLSARPVVAIVNGEAIEVMPEDVAPAAVQEVAVAKPVTTAPVAPKPAPAAAPVAGGKSVVAPLPGVVETIKVKEGDVVKPGQELVILEAMKMKNAIRSTRDGKIAKIYVTAGQQVAHNHVLLDFAD